jgi:hypothetical protein
MRTTSIIDMNLEPIAYFVAVGGEMRPIYEEHGRQFVIDDDGSRVYGVWFIPRDAADEPLIVTTADDVFPF